MVATIVPLIPAFVRSSRLCAAYSTPDEQSIAF
jgi:hypothetical protein